MTTRHPGRVFVDRSMSLAEGGGASSVPSGTFASPFKGKKTVTSALHRDDRKHRGSAEVSWNPSRPGSFISVIYIVIYIPTDAQLCRSQRIGR